jgi:hypothetical protein
MSAGQLDVLSGPGEGLVSMQVPVSVVAPDLRYALAPALAVPGETQHIGRVAMRAQGSLPPWRAVPTYLRYSDRNVVVDADGIDTLDELERYLGDHVQALGRHRDLDDLSAAVVALDAADYCFRESGLWQGNVYLAGTSALGAVLHLAQIAGPRFREPEMVSRELGALELAYLFPIARRFRAGDYDGQVQYRLNGWGRAVALRLAGSPAGADRAAGCRAAISDHLNAERHQYAAFLGQLDPTCRDYPANRLDQALKLPIPVLV